MENVKKKLLQQKVAQNVAISLGYLIFKKNPKLPNWQKNPQSGHPGPNIIKLFMAIIFECY